MNEHQLHLLFKLVFTLLLAFSLLAVFRFLTNRWVKKEIAGSRRKNGSEFMNFDETRKRLLNQRHRFGKTIKKTRKRS